jgi:hypothetical protein
MSDSFSSYLAAIARREIFYPFMYRTIEQAYSSKSDLKDQPLANPDLIWFSDRKSYMRKGQGLVG